MERFIYLILLLSIATFGQDHNYVQTKIFNAPIQSTSVKTEDTKNRIQKIFYDGLGRPIQKIDYKQSNIGTDIVTHIGYDGFGRQIKEYLPYSTSTATLNFYNNAEASTHAYYNTVQYENTTNPYSEKLFDNLSVDRIIKLGAPGNDWKINGTSSSDHSIKIHQSTNGKGEVKYYKLTTPFDYSSIGYYNYVLGDNGFYSPNDLYKITTSDENWTISSGNNNTTDEFKNKEGQLLLKRNYNNGVKHDTYYIYDQYGNLTIVIPPLATNYTTQLDELCYRYRYDYRNRLVEKKLPGKQWEFIVYDKLNRIVATGPAFSPFNNANVNTKGWIISKYDIFNRPVYTGYQESSTVSSAGRKVLQDQQNAMITTMSEKKLQSGTIDGIPAYYSNTVAPTQFKLLSVNYYDNYSFPSVSPIPAMVESQPILTTGKVKTLTTGSWVRVCTSSTANLGETTSIFYDAKARAVRQFSKNYLQGYSQIDSKLSFTGIPEYTITTHKRSANDQAITTTDRFVYSDQDRLISHSHQIDNKPVQFLQKNVYNEMGQLIKKTVGNSVMSGATGLQIIDYKYNIRGWLTDINDVDNLSKYFNPKDLFAFRINYNKPVTGNISGVKKLYNGNIAETFWRTNSDNTMRKYSYEYDHLNRMLHAVYQKPGTTAPNSYREKLNYDKNGNITSLIRNGTLDHQQSLIILEIDNLIYSYTPNSNKLVAVTDNSLSSEGFYDGNTSGADFTYDANGNMITDRNKGITSINYNHLNLPTKIIFNNDLNTRIEYLYDAGGRKVQKKVNQYTPPPGIATPIVNSTDYLDGFQYKDGVLKFFAHAEGYVNNTNSNGNVVYNYVFNYKDHLGNVRLSYGVGRSNDLKIIEENNYYPFGLKHKGYNSEAKNYSANIYGTVDLHAVVTSAPLEFKYKYDGKELQDELGLNFYDYGARNYDAALGSWMNIDPMAEKSRRFSPYVNVLNNPVFFIDPDGMFAKPSPLEAALISKNVYGDQVDLQGGWKVSTAGDGLPLDSDSGLRSAVYERTIDGKTEYTYATAGTEKSGKDYKNNISQLVGLSKQYKESKSNAIALKEKIGNKEFS